METEGTHLTITPKGIIFMALGGYTGHAEENTQKVVDALTKSMGERAAIVKYVNGELGWAFISPQPQEVRPNWFQRLMAKPAWPWNV